MLLLYENQPQVHNMAGSVQTRQHPFAKDPPSPAPSKARPKSGYITSPQGTLSPVNHAHSPAFSPLGGANLTSATTARYRAGSVAQSQSSGTFAPQFIKSEKLQRAGDALEGLEGENDFSGKRYVWLADPNVAFVKGWIVEELEDSRLLVQCDDGSVRAS